MSEVSGPSDKRTISFLPELEKPELCVSQLSETVFSFPNLLKTICDVAHSVFVAQAALSQTEYSVPALYKMICTWTF